MNIVRALLGSFIATALVVGCGSDSGSSGGNNALAKCAAGNGKSSSDACVSCMQSKCGSQMNKCYGANFSGGQCSALLSCAKKASDPCNNDCSPDSTCQSCIVSDLAPCVLQNCASDCESSTDGSGGSGNGTGGGGNGTGATTGSSIMTCSDLSTCCGKISNASAKSSCQSIADMKNDSICSVAGSGFSGLCP